MSGPRLEPDGDESAIRGVASDATTWGLGDACDAIALTLGLGPEAFTNLLDSLMNDDDNDEEEIDDFTPDEYERIISNLW